MERLGCLGIITVYALAIFLMLWALCSCSHTMYVPVESVRTEHREVDSSELMGAIKTVMERLRQKERQIDSLMQSQSERLVLSDNGDTLRHDREKIVYRASHREKELERLVESKSDSIRELRQRLESVKSDSVPVPYPVEKQLTRWEQTKMDFGGFALSGVVVILCIAVLWLIKKFRK